MKQTKITVIFSWHNDRRNSQSWQRGWLKGSATLPRSISLLLFSANDFIVFWQTILVFLSKLVIVCLCILI